MMYVIRAYYRGLRLGYIYHSTRATDSITKLSNFDQSAVSMTSLRDSALDVHLDVSQSKSSTYQSAKASLQSISEEMGGSVSVKTVNAESEFEPPPNFMERIRESVARSEKEVEDKERKSDRGPVGQQSSEEAVNSFSLKGVANAILKPFHIPSRSFFWKSSEPYKTQRVSENTTMYIPKSAPETTEPSTFSNQYDEMLEEEDEEESDAYASSYANVPTKEAEDLVVSEEGQHEEEMRDEAASWEEDDYEEKSEKILFQKAKAICRDALIQTKDTYMTLLQLERLNKANMDVGTLAVPKRSFSTVVPDGEKTKSEDLSCITKSNFKMIGKISNPDFKPKTGASCNGSTAHNCCYTRNYGTTCDDGTKCDYGTMCDHGIASPITISNFTKTSKDTVSNYGTILNLSDYGSTPNYGTTLSHDTISKIGTIRNLSNYGRSTNHDTLPSHNTISQSGTNFKSDPIPKHGTTLRSYYISKSDSISKIDTISISNAIPKSGTISLNGTTFSQGTTLNHTTPHHSDTLSNYNNTYSTMSRDNKPSDTTFVVNTPNNSTDSTNNHTSDKRFRNSGSLRFCGSLRNYSTARNCKYNSHLGGLLKDCKVLKRNEMGEFGHLRRGLADKIDKLPPGKCVKKIPAHKIPEGCFEECPVSFIKKKDDRETKFDCTSCNANRPRISRFTPPKKVKCVKKCPPPPPCPPPDVPMGKDLVIVDVTKCLPEDTMTCITSEVECFLRNVYQSPEYFMYTPYSFYQFHIFLCPLRVKNSP